jgi:hypothetical protein
MRATRTSIELGALSEGIRGVVEGSMNAVKADATPVADVPRPRSLQP